MWLENKKINYPPADSGEYGFTSVLVNSIWELQLTKNSKIKKKPNNALRCLVDKSQHLQRKSLELLFSALVRTQWLRNKKCPDLKHTHAHIYAHTYTIAIPIHQT